MPDFIDLTGRTFGRWTALRPLLPRKWECLCECGRIVAVDGATLRNGTSKSCGCHRAEQTAARLTKHGHARKGGVRSEWNIWSGMRQRCHNPNNPSYARYGGRGIVVCERWRGSFEAFFADMGPRPANTTVERIDNNGPYGPENCRWGTRREQARNTRQNRHLSLNGLTMTLAEWGETIGINPDTITERLRMGWPIQRALTVPVRHR